MNLLVHKSDLIWLIIIGNVLMYLATLGISSLWSRVYGHVSLPVSRVDVRTSIMVLIINVLVAIPGLFLMNKGYIEFVFEGSFVRDVALLLIGFDLLMYGLHRLTHLVQPFNKFHEKHHEHVYFNVISLYVMDPLEAILFGVMLTLVVIFFTVNLFSFILFLIINWFLGVVGHLNTDSLKQPLFFGNHIFHKMHHQYGQFNFGFYTVIWDKLFDTYYFAKAKRIND